MIIFVNDIWKNIYQKMMKNFIIILGLLKVILCESCGTPVECYTKAISLLQQDREEMHKVKDKFEQEKTVLEKKIQDQADLIIQLQMALQSESNERVNSQNSLQNGINDINNRISSTPKSISGCYIKECAIGDWGDCCCDGDAKAVSGGCNPDNRDYSYQTTGPSGSNCWNCGGHGGNKRISVKCCNLPFY